MVNHPALMLLAILNLPGSVMATETQLVAKSSNPEIATIALYYPITGSTAPELRSQMNRLGPIDPATGSRFDAYTRWSVRWYYHYQNQDSRCQFTSAEVKTTVTITLPQWNPPPQASTHLRDRWQAYINALALHENGHQQHGVKASAEILQALWQTPPTASCQDLQRAANQAAEKIIQKYNQEDISYDRRTKHGATQGAIFP